MALKEPMPEMFRRSKIITLDIAQLPENVPAEENIAQFFAESEARRSNPRLPRNRQQFNNQLLASSGMRYLIGQYGEDHKALLVGSQIAQEKRTLHMGVDVFSRGLEPVFAPCDGAVVRTGREEGDHGYGYYVIFDPHEAVFQGLYLFLGHLSRRLPSQGKVKAGERIGTLGDYRGNENGGWSRHLHMQMLTDLPPEHETPDGYSSRANFSTNSRRFPNPMQFFPQWQPL